MRYFTKSVKFWLYCTFFKSRVRYCVQSVKLRCYCTFFKSSISTLQYVTLWWYLISSSSVSGSVASPSSGISIEYTVHILLQFAGSVLSFSLASGITGWTILLATMSEYRKEWVFYWPPSEITMSSTCYPCKYQSQELATLKPGTLWND